MHHQHVRVDLLSSSSTLLPQPKHADPSPDAKMTPTPRRKAPVNTASKKVPRRDDQQVSADRDLDSRPAARAQQRAPLEAAPRAVSHRSMLTQEVHQGKHASNRASALGMLQAVNAARSRGDVGGSSRNSTSSTSSRNSASNRNSSTSSGGGGGGGTSSGGGGVGILLSTPLDFVGMSSDDDSDEEDLDYAVCASPEKKTPELADVIRKIENCSSDKDMS
jgi:hypothetical protein